MDRACLSAAALAATVCLLIAAPAVRAQADTAPLDGTAAATDEAAPSNAGSTTGSGDTASVPGSSGGSATDADSGSTTSSGASTPAGGAPAQQGASGAQSAPGAPTGPQTPSSAPTQTAPPAPTPAPAPPRDPVPPPSSSAASAAFVPSTGEPRPPAAPKLEPSSPPTATGPVEHSQPATDGGAGTWRAEPGRSLERLVRRVDRELGNLQPQIDALQRRLDEGAPPPQAQVIRLRSSLQRIAPALLALDTRFASSGPLSPRVKALLRRVRVRAAGARASAAGLIVALRRSGARGAEVRSLLRELESLTAARAALAFDAPAAPAPGSDATATFTRGEAAPTAFPPQLTALSPQPPAADGRAAGSSDAERSSDSPPSNSAPGSASASPGGVFSGAGMASLAILLFGFALSRLQRRVDLPPGRGYAAAFLTPLERPG